nr:MAG TPA: hypothetical protein [Caudoviricetes sp.]
MNSLANLRCFGVNFRFITHHHISVFKLVDFDGFEINT